MTGPNQSITPREAAAGSFDIIIDIRTHGGSTPTLPGALLITAHNLTSDPARFIPNRDAPVLIVCDIGMRSLTVVEQLHGAGYVASISLEGGMEEWIAQDLPVVTPEGLSTAEFRRYDRQLKLPGVGVAGQLDLQRARVAVVGAGGLGTPVLAYLAGAGVGNLTIVDSDRIEVSNLHRQPIYTTQDVGAGKARAAASFVKALNPEITVTPISERLDSSNAPDLLAHHDVVVTCTDSFDTTHAINQAALHHRIPMVFGSVYRFEGQLGVFDAQNGPCYACVFPQHTGGTSLDCSIVGVMGPVTGVIGGMQAAEVMKLLTCIGDPIIGRLHLYDSRTQILDSVQIRKNPACTMCGLLTP